MMASRWPSWPSWPILWQIIDDECICSGQKLAGWQCSGKCIAQNGVELPLKTHQIMPEEQHPLRDGGAAPSN